MVGCFWIKNSLAGGFMHWLIRQVNEAFIFMPDADDFFGMSECQPGGVSCCQGIKFFVGIKVFKRQGAVKQMMPCDLLKKQHGIRYGQSA